MQQSVPNQVICTLFDHRYLPRGLCMIDSVRRHGGHQAIWVLCLSEECERALTLMALDGVKILPLHILERHLPALLEAKANRNAIEYYFTCMAALHRYVFDTVPQVDCTMYVDADIQFFTDPTIVFDAIDDAPAAITPHHFPAAIAGGLKKFGLYNAGWSAFRRTPEGHALLDWWLTRSLEWCYDYVDGDRYANQGYLMHFHEIAPHTKILDQKGFNCAPWNVGGYRVTEQGSRLLVDGEPLVFFHFHGVKKHYGLFYFDSHRDYHAAMPLLVRNRIYRPYIRELIAQEKRAGAILADLSLQMPLPRTQRISGFNLLAMRSFIEQTRGSVIGAIKRGLDLASGRPILVWGDRVL